MFYMINYDYFAIFNYRTTNEYQIDENMTLHPYQVENSIGMTILKETMALEFIPPSNIPEEYDNSIYSSMDYFSLDQAKIFLTCFKISNRQDDEKLSLFNFLNDMEAYDTYALGPFPLGLISNPTPFHSIHGNLNNFSIKDKSSFDSIINSSYYQFGVPFILEEVTTHHISNSLKFYEKVKVILKNQISKDDKNTSRLLNNILLTYYDSITSNTLISISSSMAIIESIFGSPSNITISIQERVPKFLECKTEKLSKILRKMYDTRSVNAHLKYTLSFSSNADLHDLYSYRRIMVSLTGILIEKWVDEIFNGKSRKEFRNSIIDDKKYELKSTISKT